MLTFEKLARLVLSIKAINSFLLGTNIALRRSIAGFINLTTLLKRLGVDVSGFVISRCLIVVQSVFLFSIKQLSSLAQKKEILS